MKKYLVLAGLLAAFAQPVMAQGMYYNYGYGCNTCNPCQPVVREIQGQICPPACPVTNPCPCPTGAACPVVAPTCPVMAPCECKPVCNPCNPCGAAAPVCCPEKKGFWKKFFSF